MPATELPADLAAAVGFLWQNGEHGGLLAAVLPPAFAEADVLVRAVLPGFLGVRSWGDIAFLTAGIAERRSRSTDLRSVYFGHAEAGLQGDGARVGLEIGDGTDNVIWLDERDFLALAARWLGALRDGALAHDDPATHAAWWPEWTANVARIERMAAAA